MRWWLNLLVRHPLFRGLQWFTVVNAVILSLWFVPLLDRLLFTWVLPTIGLLYAITAMTRVMLTVKSVGASPNIGTVGFWLVSLTNFVFAAVVLVPTLLGRNTLVGEPVTALTWTITYAYSYAEMTFFLVAHHSAQVLTGVRGRRGEPGPQGPPGERGPTGYAELAPQDRVQQLADRVALEDGIARLEATVLRIENTTVVVADDLAAAVIDARNEAANIAVTLAAKVQEARDEARAAAVEATMIAQRLEDGAAVVASDLDAAHRRADAVDPEEDHGAASDAAARSPDGMADDDAADRR